MDTQGFQSLILEKATCCASTKKLTESLRSVADCKYLEAWELDEVLELRFDPTKVSASTLSEKARTFGFLAVSEERRGSCCSAS